MSDAGKKAWVTARVRLTVEINLSQPWPADMPVQDVWAAAERQAVEEAERVAGRSFIIVPGTVVVSVVVRPTDRQ